MEQQIAELLRELAAQLGVTVDFLWTTLVAAQYARGMWDLSIQLLSGLGFLIVLVQICRHMPEWWDDPGEKGVVLGIAHIFAGVVLLAGFLKPGATPLLELVQPNYTALRELLALTSRLL